MSATRESIAASIAALVFGATFSSQVNGALTWVTTSRRLKLWGDVDRSRQPACYLVEHDEEEAWSGRGQLQRRHLKLSAWCYASTENPDTVGGQYINYMLEAIENSLAPDDPTQGVLTLGGQVNWCRISGRTFKDPGDIDNQALLIVPILVLWP